MTSEQAAAVNDWGLADALNHLGRCGVPKRVAEVAVGPLDAKKPAAQAAQDFLENRKAFLLLLGETGTGKSVAAALTLFAARGVYETAPGTRVGFLDSSAGLWVNADDICRGSYYDAAFNAFVARLIRVEWLVLDDLGAELGNDAWQATLYRLLGARYDARHPTVITSNLSAEEFKARYGARIADRVRGDGLVVQCGSQSMRRIAL